MNKISNNEKWEKITQEFHKNHQKKENQESLCFDKEELGKNIETFDSILQSLFSYTLSRDLSEKSIATLLYKKIKTITNANEATREGIAKTFLGSSEGVALLSLYYNNPSLIGGGLRGAYEEKNRFKMWFEIRYNSNKGKDIGIAKRRFAESNVFGLFENTKRGKEYKNTIQWGESEANLKETMRFFISLHSKFEKGGCNTYFEYVKYYEKNKFFGKTTILERLKWEKTNNMLDFELHYKPHTEVFSPFVKTFNEAMKNAGCLYKFDLESIVAVNSDNRANMAKTINERSAKGELAIILEEKVDLGFFRYEDLKIQNLNKLHIILSFDNHIDCLGFEYPQELSFYTLEDDKIKKLKGCDNPLIHQSFSFKDMTISGLAQYDTNGQHIHCFKSLSSGRCSPNLSVYDKKTFKLVATIYNLRSEEDNNA